MEMEVSMKCIFKEMGGNSNAYSPGFGEKENRKQG